MQDEASPERLLSGARRIGPKIALTPSLTSVCPPSNCSMNSPLLRVEQRTQAGCQGNSEGACLRLTKSSGRAETC